MDAYAAPDALQRRARELGMVPGGDPAFLDPDGTVKGVPGAAEPAALRIPALIPPEMNVPEPTPTPTAAPTPTPAPTLHAHSDARGDTHADPLRAGISGAGPRSHPHPSLHDPRQVTEVSDREPPRRRVPAPARAARPGATRRPGPGARPARRPAPGRPGGPKVIRLGSPRPRLRMVSLALTLVMIAFVVRLLQVQAVDASEYAAKAEQNRYVGRTLAAERGEITDRNGVELATSVDAYDITADPSMFTPKSTKAGRRPRAGRRPPRADPRAGRGGHRREAEDARTRATRCSRTARPPRCGRRSRT